MFLNRLPLRVIPFPESASPIELPITGKVMDPELQ